MKKIIFSIILAASIMSSFAQDSIKNKIYHNEFGIDATGFIKQFLNFSSSQNPEYYSPTYYLTYRRHFKPGNIRFAIGGSYAEHDIQSGLPSDQNKYHYNARSIDARIGWEFVTNLSKRWQVFYGLDFKPSYSYIKDDAPYWNGGYANGDESKTQLYAFSPLLGFKFSITKRLSISTEASFAFILQQQYTRHYYIPETADYPSIPDVIIPKAKQFSTSFTQPLSVFIAFDI
jgi:hypothetical protein